MKNKAFMRVWCFPQNFIGALVCKFTKAEKHEGYYTYGLRNGVCLGEYIFIPKGANETYLKHERGHQKQSYILGWFYLLVIGIPSMVWNACFDWYRKKYNKSYYSFYTESWADKLGGVKR